MKLKSRICLLLESSLRMCATVGSTFQKKSTQFRYVFCDNLQVQADLQSSQHDKSKVRYKVVRFDQASEPEIVERLAVIIRYSI